MNTIPFFNFSKNIISILIKTYVLIFPYIPIVANKNLSSNNLSLLFSHYPLCKKLIELVYQFMELFNEHQLELLDVWVQDVSKSQIN